MATETPLEMLEVPASVVTLSPIRPTLTYNSGTRRHRSVS
jgi:hypothetical protein